jgi:hypothetical protein
MMLKRLLQAATLTFLLNLVAYMNSQDASPSVGLLPSHTVSKIVLSQR